MTALNDQLDLKNVTVPLTSQDADATTMTLTPGLASQQIKETTLNNKLDLRNTVVPLTSYDTNTSTVKPALAVNK